MAITRCNFNKLMPKNNKTKKVSVKEEEIKKPEEEEEEKEKEGGALSDGVLDAFDEVAPVDPLLEDENLLSDEEEDDMIDSGDYKANDEW
jgi:hypothetical protein